MVEAEVHEAITTTRVKCTRPKNNATTTTTTTFSVEQSALLQNRMQNEGVNGARTGFVKNDTFVIFFRKQNLWCACLSEHPLSEWPFPEFAKLITYRAL